MKFQNVKAISQIKAEKFNNIPAWEKYQHLDLTTSDIDVVKEAKIAQLNQACFLAITEGFQSDALGVIHSYPSDTEAQNNLSFAIKRLELEPDGATVDFKTLDAGYLPHTLLQLNEVFKDGFDYGQAQIIKYNQLKSQVNAAITNEEVDSFNW